MAQTSVEFLEEKFISIFVNDEGFKKLIEKAKEMHQAEKEKMYSEVEVYNIIEKLFEAYASYYTNKAIDDFEENFKK